MLDLLEISEMSIEEKREWERVHSSLVRTNPRKHVTYEQCRAYSCNSIVKGLTQVTVNQGEIIDIPQGVPFHLIGQVDDGYWYERNNPESYYKALQDSQFMACSIIHNQNVSHYEGDIFFLYNIHQEDIAHVFPMDSNTNQNAKTEERLTWVPSFWLTLSELEIATDRIGGYNQITCRTKREEETIRPVAVAAFEKVDDFTKAVANSFGIGIVILHPNDNSINYVGDMLSDYYKFQEANSELKKGFGLAVDEFLYLN